jgi:hypothetical protein
MKGDNYGTRAYYPDELSKQNVALDYGSASAQARRDPNQISDFVNNNFNYNTQHIKSHNSAGNLNNKESLEKVNVNYQNYAQLREQELRARDTNYNKINM